MLSLGMMRSWPIWALRGRFGKVIKMEIARSRREIDRECGGRKSFFNNNGYAVAASDSPAKYLIYRTGSINAAQRKRWPYGAAIVSLLLGIILFSETAIGSEIVSIENDVLRVSINARGAELWSVRHKDSGTEYLWQGDPGYWENRAPVMFPVNVRFKDNRFTYKGITYEIPKMGMAVYSDFEVEKRRDGQSVVFSLKSNEETRQRYPFDFVFKVIYRLKGNRLTNEFVVENEGGETMYFATGGHPGFSCPFVEGRDRSDYEISFSRKLSVNRSEIVDSLIQETEVPFLKNEDSFALDDPRIPNGGMFQKNMKARRISVGRTGEAPYLTLDLGDFPNVNLWSPPGMPFVCIEPMVSHHDLQVSPMAIEEKSYLIPLKPGKSKRYAFSIMVHHNGTL